jgi:hypothetical protein
LKLARYILLRVIPWAQQASLFPKRDNLIAIPFIKGPKFYLLFHRLPFPLKRRLVYSTVTEFFQNNVLKYCFVYIFKFFILKQAQLASINFTI